MTYRALQIGDRHHVVCDCGSWDTEREALECAEWLNLLERQAVPLVSLDAALRLFEGDAHART